MTIERRKAPFVLNGRGASYSAPGRLSPSEGLSERARGVINPFRRALSGPRPNPFPRAKAGPPRMCPPPASSARDRKCREFPRSCPEVADALFGHSGRAGGDFPDRRPELKSQLVYLGLTSCCGRFRRSARGRIRREPKITLVARETRL